MSKAKRERIYVLRVDTRVLAYLKPYEKYLGFDKKSKPRAFAHPDYPQEVSGTLKHGFFLQMHLSSRQRRNFRTWMRRHQLPLKEEPVSMTYKQVV